MERVILLVLEKPSGSHRIISIQRISTPAILHLTKTAEDDNRNLSRKSHSAVSLALWFFRTCPHRVNVRIIRHNFVGDKAKIRRRAVALQGFLRQHRTKLVLKMRRQIFTSDCIEIPQAYYRMSRDFCAR